MATKVPSSVLDRESPAKGFAIKPRRFSKLYGICKRGIIYFYPSKNASVISPRKVCFMHFAYTQINDIVWFDKKE